MINYDRIMEIEDTIPTEKTETLSTGDKIIIKTFLPLSVKRAIANMIFNSGLVLAEGQLVPRIDRTLMDSVELYSFIKYMTDIDIDGVAIDDLVDSFTKTGLNKEIERLLDSNLVKDIRMMVNDRIKEEQRIQEVEGMLGYQLTNTLNTTTDETISEIKETLIKLQEEQE